MKRAQPFSSLGEIRTKIRTSGLRSTAPRVAVLQYLQTATTPVSHAELFEALADQGFDRATIYRNLIDLTEIGLLSRTDLGDHVGGSSFDARGNVGIKPNTHTLCVPIAARWRVSRG